MDKENVRKAIEELKKSSKKRNFKQSFDLIINLKGLDLKKPENHVDVLAHLHYPKGKKLKICTFAGPELREESNKVMDTTIFVDEFDKYLKDKKGLKDLANSHDFFVAQANIMPKVAQVFGKILGTRGKMPNPKAGCVVPPKTSLQPLYDSLQKTLHLKAKTQLVIKCPVGVDDQPEEEVIDNILTVFNAVKHKLPNEEHNVKSVLLKLTMSQPLRIDK